MAQGLSAPYRSSLTRGPRASLETLVLTLRDYASPIASSCCPVARFWHQFGVYFGLTEPDEADRRALGEAPRPSLARVLIRAVIGASLAGLFFGLAMGSVGAGIAFGVTMVVVGELVPHWQSRR